MSYTESSLGTPHSSCCDDLRQVEYIFFADSLEDLGADLVRLEEEVKKRSKYQKGMT